MKTLRFATTNAGKLENAIAVMKRFGITVEQQLLSIDEIQSEDPKAVAIDKSNRAFELVKKPVIITDDSWAFLGLKGFPGVYMHSMNEWLSPEDFLRLTHSLENRNVTMTQYLVYKDAHRQKVFTSNHHGTLLKEIKGTSPHPSHTLITMNGEDGLSIAEVHSSGRDRADRPTAAIWHEFADWFRAIVD